MSKLIVRIRQYEPPKQRPKRGWALGMYLLAGAGLFISSILCGALFPNADAQHTLLIVGLLFYLPFIALPIFLGVRRRPETLEAYRPDGLSLSNVILIVLLAVVGLFVTADVTVLCRFRCKSSGSASPQAIFLRPWARAS